MNSRWRQTTLDGLGRQLTVVTGYGTAPPGTGGTKDSEVDYYYDSCACSPAGKLFKKSQPYVPGNTVSWTQYTYDGMGRTTSVILPNNPATSATWGTTAYVYQGNTVKITDPAGNWKTFTMDAFGNLTSVLEPNPAGWHPRRTTRSSRRSMVTTAWGGRRRSGTIRRRAGRWGRWRTCARR